MFKKRSLATILGGAALLISSTASATTFEQLDFGEVVSEATACVIADVESVTSGKRDGQVVTLTTFKIRKTAFGTVGDTITVVTPGGNATMGSLQVSEVVAGSPRFFNGQDSLMLLSENAGTGDYSIVGVNQGLFSVSEGANGVNRVVLPVSVGGDVSVEEALEIIRDQRVNPSSETVGQ